MVLFVVVEIARKSVNAELLKDETSSAEERASAETGLIGIRLKQRERL